MSLRNVAIDAAIMQFSDRRARWYLLGNPNREPASMAQGDELRQLAKFLAEALEEWEIDRA